MRVEGRLTRWDDARGFGAIEPTQGGEPLFVHISAWPRAAGRPQLQQRVSFEVAMGPRGRRAVQVQPLPAPASAQRAGPAPAPGRGRADPVRHGPGQGRAAWGGATLLPAFALLLLGVAALGPAPAWLVPAYLALSALTFGVYAFDKSAALRGGWRVSESTLHLLALAGGWPGALLAQQRLRHKSAKAAFRQVFWVCVLANVLALLLCCTPLGRWLVV